MEFRITNMLPEDWSQVAAIFEEGVNTRMATFMSEIPGWEQWDSGHVKSCRLVAKSGNTILGWCALSPTSSRPYYAGVAEVSIYIGSKYQGYGVGTALLKQLIDESEQNGFWTLYSGIIRENHSSIKLHQKCGFREIGIREKVGKMDDRIWMDVVAMERRSSVIGVD